MKLSKSVSIFSQYFCCCSQPSQPPPAIIECAAVPTNSTLLTFVDRIERLTKDIDNYILHSTAFIANSTSPEDLEVIATQMTHMAQQLAALQIAVLAQQHESTTSHDDVIEHESQYEPDTESIPTPLVAPPSTHHIPGDYIFL